MPRRRYPWVKLWFDDLGDAGIRQLSMAEKGCWWGMKILAGKSPERGKLQFSSGLPMTTDQIAQALGLSSDERPILDSTIKKMTNLGELHANSECLVIVNWKSEQEVYPSDFEDYHGQAKRPESPSGGESAVATGASAALFPDILLESSALTPDTLLKDVRGKKKEERRKTRETLTSTDVSDNNTIPTSKEVGLHPEQTVESPVDSTQEGSSRVRGGEPLPGEPKGEHGRGGVTPAKKQKVSEAEKGADLKRSDVQRVFDAVHEFYGFPDKDPKDRIPNYGKEGAAIKRILTRGFSVEEIVRCWKAKVDAKGGDFVPFSYVNEDIGKERSDTGRTGGRSAAPQRDPGAKPDYKGSIRRFHEQHG